MKMKFYEEGVPIPQFMQIDNGDQLKKVINVNDKIKMCMNLKW